jgi:hypothetical protein
MYISLKSLENFKILTTDNRELRFIDLLIDQNTNKSAAIVVKNTNSFNYLEFNIPIYKLKYSEREPLQIDLRYSELENFITNYNGFLIQPSPQFEPMYIEYLDSYEFKSENSLTLTEDKLISIKDFLKLKIECLNEKFGKISDLFLAPEDFSLQYFTVGTTIGFRKRSFWLSYELIERIDWDHHLAYLNVTKEAVMNSPQIQQQSIISERINNIIDSYIKKTERFDKDGFLQ